MVQEFNVVRCFSCEAFQVEQVKKSTNKWSCKLCHEKQSLKQIYFRGTGKHCRLNCQELNMKRHKKEEETVQNIKDEEENSYGNEDEVEVHGGLVRDWLPLNEEKSTAQNDDGGGNKWFRFLEKTKDDVDEDNESSSLAIAFRGENNNSRKRKQTSNSNYSNKSTKFHSNENGAIMSSKASDLSKNSFSSNEVTRPAVLGNSQIYQARVPPVSLKEVLNDDSFTNDISKCQKDKQNEITETKWGEFISAPPVSHDTDVRKTNSNEDNRNIKQNKVETKWSKFLSVEEDEDFSDDENTCMLKT